MPTNISADTFTVTNLALFHTIVAFPEYYPPAEAPNAPAADRVIEVFTRVRAQVSDGHQQNAGRLTLTVEDYATESCSTDSLYFATSKLRRRAHYSQPIEAQWASSFRHVENAVMMSCVLGCFTVHGLTLSLVNIRSAVTATRQVPVEPFHGSGALPDSVPNLGSDALTPEFSDVTEAFRRAAVNLMRCFDEPRSHAGGGTNAAALEPGAAARPTLFVPRGSSAR